MTKNDSFGGFFVMLVVYGLVFLIAKASKKNKDAQAQKIQAAANSDAQKHAAEAAAAQAKAQSILPPVTHIAPTVHVTPHDHSGMFEGSLHADDSGEGRDPHDHGFETEIDTPSMHSEEAINASFGQISDSDPIPGLKLAFDGDSVTRALVMQEVLRRPCERRR